LPKAPARMPCGAGKSVSSTAVMRLSFIICLGRLSTESELAPFLFGQPVAGESPGRSLVPLWMNAA
jgi:hypothetical protein